MYYVYVNDSIDSTFRSPVAADLRVLELRHQGSDAHKEYDEGAC